MLPHIQAGAARALVVAGIKRLPELPDVPTLVEAGLSGYPDEVWMGLVAPGGTPGPIIERLNGAINEALRSPEARATFARIGFEARPGSAQEFAARIEATRKMGRRHQTDWRKGRLKQAWFGSSGYAAAAPPMNSRLIIR